MKKKIDISGIDPLLFVGVGDQNIKVIQANIPAQVIVRGTDVYLDGEKNAISLAEMVINQMILTINNKGYIEPVDITNYLNLDLKESNEGEKHSQDEVILFTHK